MIRRACGFRIHLVLRKQFFIKLLRQIIHKRLPKIRELRLQLLLHKMAASEKFLQQRLLYMYIQRYIYGFGAELVKKPAFCRIGIFCFF